jgi:hypothetical protein
VQQEQGSEALLAIEWLQDSGLNVAVHEVETHVPVSRGGFDDLVEEAVPEEADLLLSSALREVTLDDRDLDLSDAGTVSGGFVE